ncbi:hypothetical protein [Vibrio phage vB_VneS_J26]
MNKLTKTALTKISKGDEVVKVSLNGAGRFPVSPNLAKELLKVIDSDAKHALFTDRTLFIHTVRGIVGNGSLLRNMENY